MPRGSSRSLADRRSVRNNLRRSLRRLSLESLEERRVLATQVFNNVPEAANYSLVYELAIPNAPNYSSGTVPYNVDNAAKITQPFDRVAYYLELQQGSGPLQYVFVSMDAFTTNVNKIGVPNFLSGEFYQQNVANMNVASNVAGITTGSGITTGNIEFWPSDYNQSNAVNVPNASASAYDFGDGNASRSTGYGSMQIHNYDIDGAGPGTTGQTLFAFNHWNVGQTADIGIGTQATNNPDWTFAANAGGYTIKNMAILVRQTTVPLVARAPAAPAALVANAPELAGYQLVYQKNIADSATLNGTNIVYDVNNTSLVPAGSFDRVAYYVQLDGNFVEVSFNSAGFAADATKLGIPNTNSGEFYQQSVSGLNVASNVAGVVSGSGMTGNVEFWPSNYTQTKAATSPANASDATFDFGDSGASTANGYGSMQVHNTDIDGAGPGTAGQTLFAYNRWGNAGGISDLGIGNRAATDTDWTFAQNANTYTTKQLYVLVRPRAVQAPTAPAAPGALVANAPELADYQLLYQKNLPAAVNFNSTAINYDIDNTALVPAGSFDRVAYYFQLDGNWVEASFNSDGFTTQANKTGIPNVASGEFYQQYVANLNVKSNVAGLDVTNSPTGNIEFWPSNYDRTNPANIPGANPGVFDFGDGGAGTSAGHGSMQIHNYGAGKTIFGYSQWGNGGGEMGIGNRANADTDWTLSGNGSTYTTRTLYVLARPRTIGTAGNDNIVLSKVNGLIQYTVNGGAPVVISSSAPIVIDGGEGDDTLTFDFSGGNPIPIGGITFNGGNSTAGDKIIVPAVVEGTATYTFATTTAGALAMSNFGTINYTGVESVVNNGSAADIVVNLPAGAQANLQDDGTPANGLSRLVSTNGAFQPFDIPSPSGSLTINGGGGTNVNIVALDSSFASPVLNFGGTATDTFQLSAAERIPNATTLGVNAATLNLNGFSETVNGLSGTGVINNSGAAASLILNSTATTTFSGALQGALSLVKGGTGTQTLSANSTYTGGTTVNQGTLALAAPIGAAPLGTGALNMAGGTLSVQSGGLYQQQTVGLTGWNQDIIAEKSAANPQAVTSTSMPGNWVWYEKGAPGSTQGLPTGGAVTSQFGAKVGFQFQPYDANNAIVVGSGFPASVTANLTTPAKFQTIQFLNSAQGGSGVDWNAKLIFSDGTSTTLTSVHDPDWTQNGQNGLTTVGLVPRGATWSGYYTNTLNIYEHDFTLSAADQAKTLQSITFTQTGGGPLMMFAVSGVASAPVVYPQTLNVTGNATIDVKNGAAAAFGALSIGSNQLSVTGGNGANLAFGATSLTGNATFDVAASTTLSLGALNDNGATRTITKQGSGTLALGSAAASLIDGTQVNVAAGTLLVNQATAVGSLPRVDVAAAGTLSLGASTTIAALSNSGTVNLNGNALTVGSTNNLSFTFGGVIADGAATGGQLIKAGSGTLILTGANTFSGLTTISSGALQIGNGGGTGSLGSGNIVDNASLIVNRSGAVTIAGNISGNGSFTNLGSGVTTLAGANTYTGATNITAGTVRAGTSSGAGGVFANVPEAAGYNLVYQLPIGNSNNFTTTVPYTVNNAATIPSGSFSRIGYYLELQAGSGPLQWVYVSFDAAPFSTDATKIGVPNAPTGVVYHYDAAGTLLGQVRNMTVRSNVPALVGPDRTGVTTGNVEFWATNYTQANAYNVPGADPNAYDFGDQDTPGNFGSMQIHDYGIGKTLFAFNNWNGGGGVVAIGSQPTGSPDWTFVTNVGNYSIKNLQVVVDAHVSTAIPATSPVTVNSGATLDLAGNTLSIGSLADGASGGGTVTNSAANQPVTLSLNSPSGSTTFSGIITDSSAASALKLVKNGSGTQVLAGANTYHGATVINAGTLQLGTDNALPATTSVTLGGNLDLGGKSVTIAGLSAGTASAGKVIDSNSASSANTLTLNIVSGSQTIRGLLGDATNNTFSLTKDGTGSLLIGGTNTYTGSTAINQGVVQLIGGLAPGVKIMPLGDSITFGADGGGGGTNAGYRGPLYNQLVAAGYSIQYVGSQNGNPGSLPASEILHEGHSGWKTGDVSDGILHGVKTTASGGLGWLTANPDIILLHIGTNNTGASEAQSVADVSATLDEIRNQRPTAITYVAQIIPKSGADAWVNQYKVDLANLVASKKALGYNVAIVDMNTNYPASSLPDGIHPNANGYNFMANQWYTALVSASGSGSNVLPATTALSVAAGATLDLNGITQTVASLADRNGGGGTVLNGNATTPITLTISNPGGTTSFSGALNDTSAANAITLVKAGSSIQVLSGNNTYRGATTINAGTLVAGSANALGAASAGTTVNNGGTLGLQNSITLSGEALSINGLGAAGQPGALVNISGNNTIGSGSPITAQVVSLGQIGIGSTAGTLNIQSNVDLKFSKLVVDGSGDVVVSGVISGVGASQVVTLPPHTNSQVFNNVPEAASFAVAYELPIPNNANFRGANAIPYSINDTGILNAFDRIAYYLELDTGTGLRWVWASMDAFTNNINQIGLPHNVNNPVKFQQVVNRMNVASNVPGIVTGNNISTGNIEFWPSDYNQTNAINIPGASASAFDFGDGGASTSAGHGSFQIHNYGAGQTLFGMSDWGGNNPTGNVELGIGTNTGTVQTPSGAVNVGGSPDWTFADAANLYTVKNLVVLVHESTPRTIDANNALVKQGSGTLTLTNANTYNAGTTVTAGRLLANNSTGSATGPGAVTASGTGTLGGTGAISGVVNVQSAAFLAPGNGTAGNTADIATGSLTLNSGSTFTVDINGLTANTQYDQVIVTGDAALNNATLALNATFVPGLNQYLVIINNQGSNPVGGTFNGIPDDSVITVNVGGVPRRFFIDYNFNAATNTPNAGNDVALTLANTRPNVAANSGTTTAPEGSPVTMTGTFSDADAGDVVAISASVGTVTKSGTTSGTWSWSLPTTDGPFGPVTVTITATDQAGATNTATFTYSVTNVAPTLTISGAASVNEGGSYTLNLAKSDPGTDTLGPWTINWGDGSALQAVPAGTTSITHVYADGPATRTISATASDEDGGPYASNNLSVSVLNVAPTISISGASTAVEGDLYTLALASTDPGVDTITSWTINWGDGTAPQTISGNPSSVTHRFSNGPASATISATAIDDDSGTATSNSIIVSITNAAPTATLLDITVRGNSIGTGPVTTVPGMDVGFEITATDPAADSVDAPFTFVLDWGDQSTPSTGFITAEGDALALTHIYGKYGTFHPKVTVTDRDGGSTTLMLPDVVSQQIIVADGVLYVAGGAGADRIIVQPSGGGIGVRLNNVMQPSQSASKVVVFGNGGNDNITVTGSLPIPMEFYGGDGDDYLAGGIDSDLLDGGPGKDRLLGGNGDDTLLGGDGNDTLSGGNGNDYLSGDDFVDLVGGHLLADGSPSLPGDIVAGAMPGNDTLSGDNGDDFLQAGGGNDTLNGGAGNDFMHAGAGNDRADGGAGDDLMLGDAGNDTLYGRAGVDILIGGAGTDQLYGSTGADLIYGGDFDPLSLDDAALFVLWQTFLSDPSSAVDELASAATDDPAIDTVHGEADADWYLVYANDIFKLAAERKAPNIIRQL